MLMRATVGRDIANILMHCTKVQRKVEETMRLIKYATIICLLT